MTPTLEAIPQSVKPISAKDWTYHDYLDLPDDGRIYEIIEGVLYMANAPNLDHQFAVGQIFAAINSFVITKALGYALMAPFEVHLSEKTRPVQPDVLFIKQSRWPKSGTKYFDGSPDLVIEVLSPSTARTDRFIKFGAYEKAGVPEYWIVNPMSKTVEVYTLSGGEYALLGEYSRSDVLQSNILAGFDLSVQTIFLPT